MKYDHKNIEKIKEFYEIEKELAKRLRNSSRQQRQKLYSSIYEELFQRIPYHPQLVWKSSSQDSIRRTSLQMRNIRPFLRKDLVFLEIGAGDCTLSVEVAKLVSKVYAVDVTEKIAAKSIIPQNFEFVLSDGCTIPLQANSVNIAYSYQLMEHLHPDDASEQLQDIYRVLTFGGIYICDTPNRLMGPHDVSKHFDTEAKGLHLKEYTVAELNNLFKMVGFSKIRIYIRIKKLYIFLPVFPIVLFENILSKLPYLLRRKIISNLLVRLLLGIRLIGTK